jgi:hypothetical protein
MAEIKYMDVAEFRSAGYLQEVNRRFLHPLGLALAVKVADDGTEHISGVWDYRDDPEGIRYVDGVELAQRARDIDELWRVREIERRAALGWMVQPAEEG